MMNQGDTDTIYFVFVALDWEETSTLANTRLRILAGQDF
jgi:hypothetical protein